jgi:hypothetical protein
MTTESSTLEGRQHFETPEEWYAEGERRFGSDRRAWKFVCPVCGHVAAVNDWLAVAFSCVGRWLPEARDAFASKTIPGPCNYAGGGLFRLNPVTVGPDKHDYFAFASVEVAS